MNWHSHAVGLYLWFAQPILQSAVAVILWRRNLRKQFPVFFLFLLIQITNFVVIFAGWRSGNYQLYFGLYWTSEAVNAFIGFKVIHEIFLDVFRPYHTLKDLGTLLFKWAGVVMLLVSVVVAFSNSLNQSPLIHGITTMQRSVRIVQLGLVLFLLLFSRFLGVSKKQMCFGIALGFGLLAGEDLMMYALLSGGFVTNGLFNLINMSACNLAITVWLGYAILHKTVRVSTVNRLQTQRWEQSLSDLQHPVATDSLIPMFENMVDRAFSRSSHLEGGEELSLGEGATAPKATSAAAGSKSRL